MTVVKIFSEATSFPWNLVEGGDVERKRLVVFNSVFSSCWEAQLRVSDLFSYPDRGSFG